MRKAVAVGVLVLGAMLLGTLLPGASVPGADGAAAATAGIELGTAPARVGQIAASAIAVPLRPAAALRPLLAVLQLLLALAALWIAAVAADVQNGVRALRLRQAGVRRGPPLLAPATPE
jgi:hypothetical protein